MPKEPLNRRRPRRVLGLLCAAALLVPSAACTVGAAAGNPPHFPLGPLPKPLAPCGWWYGIGEPPSTRDITFAAQHYGLVVLNATETKSLRRLKQLNPKVKVLVYKDFSSARNYPGAVVGDVDAPFLPTGIGYFKAERENPHWFAVDTKNHRIEWNSYPKHWQMTVWDPAYQKAWSDAVTAEVVREGWDGVLADNDFSSLKYYSSAVLKGTEDAAESDRVIREGMDTFLTTAGDALHKAGKMLIPNVSESHLTAGRWTAHSRYDGAMEENFGLRDTGTGELLTFKGNEWKELRSQAALGETWLLLITHTKGAREERVGYATAALLASPHTCWSGATTKDYRNPDWSRYQESNLGEAVETANRLPSGVWDRRFTGGYVAVNPTGKAARITPPPGLVNLDGGAAAPATVEIAAGDAIVLVTPTVATATTTTPTTPSTTPTTTAPVTTEPTTPTTEPVTTEPTTPPTTSEPTTPTTPTT
ncbi:putative glycoside hydrolase family 15 protein [Saccharothrix texasensis]|uniref:Putative glycosyl hydrolase-like family 15 (GHL15) protein n=1 Tax=Saccharothrix texasensis TaxID=103734 RepID=A0A3N1H1S8_9PSEU|nr:putative glycoside hydrolase family 15 protein [Saccharothrix texasensis]ROP36464.1 putative glycosyl hydrolase-like family 15 (GHL15) protein [Saccharothrix texasensis]